MPIIDLYKSGDEIASAIAECDLCIIGSGPAGSTIARELANTSLRIVVLESGGFTRNPETDSLNEIENIGRPRFMDQWGIRNRMVGGSSHTWGGRCAVFDEIDFEKRDWVPESGWPFDMTELNPYVDRTAPYLGLAVANGFSDQRFWQLSGRKPPKTEPNPDLLLPFFWQFSMDGTTDYQYEYMRFGPRLVKELAPNTTLICGATVLCIHAVPSGTAVKSVEYVSPGGRRHTLAAATVALCGGGIENARLLLSSDSVNPNGLGNDRDNVGRYLMDHPRGPVGSFKVAGSEALQKRYGRFNVLGHLFRAGLRLSPEVQRREQLVNVSAWLGEIVADDDPLNSIKRIVSGKPQLPGDALSLFSNAGLLMRGFRDYFIEKNGLPRKLQALTLDCMSEQRPDRNSRVMLADRRDRFGMRLSRIDWRIHEDEQRSMRRMAQLMAKEFPRIGLPEIQLEQWVLDGADFPDHFIDVGHPTGATRISTDPAKGVVDANCCVHGVAGLYISGMSVFPTAGHCNPTQMVVTMALRLADHLKARAASAMPIEVESMAGAVSGSR